MPRLYKIHLWSVNHLWHDGIHPVCHHDFGSQEVDVGKKRVRSGYVTYVGTDCLGELCQYPDSLFLLRSLQFTYPVVRLDHLTRFYKRGLSRRTLVVDDSRNLPFQGRRHRDDQSAVTQCGTCVLVNQTVLLCLSQYII